jgi:Flp pilus assembly protein TadG
MLRRLFPQFRRKSLHRDTRSTAAMEFALIAPTIVAILLGVYEICNAAIVYEEVQNAAHAIPASASNLAVQATGATSLTYAQIQLAQSEIWGEIPQLRNGLQNGTVSVTITSVTFLKTVLACTPSKTVTCVYTPTVVWSVAYAGGKSSRSFGATYRSCTGAPGGGQSNATLAAGVVPGGLTNDAPQSAGIATSTATTWTNGDLTALPTFTVADPDPYWAPPSPILVVDVHLKYKPLFGLFFGTGIDFYGTGFFPVRSVATSSVSANGTATAQTLSQQFTTLVDDATDAANNVIPSATSGTYCINTSANLSPPATVVSAS